METSQVYDGSCHCGQVKFTTKISPPISEQTVVQCNCTTESCHAFFKSCSHLMIYPKTAHMAFHHDDNAVKEYRFASKNFPHYFCTNCGTSLYARAEAPEQRHIVAVNVRTLAGVDIKSLKIHERDGRGTGNA